MTFGELKAGDVFRFGSQLFMRLENEVREKGDAEFDFEFGDGHMRRAVYIKGRCPGLACFFCDKTPVEHVELEWVDHGPFNRVR